MIYDAFYTILTYFIPDDVINTYPQVFTVFSIAFTLAFVIGIIFFFRKIIKRLF